MKLVKFVVAIILFPMCLTTGVAVLAWLTYALVVGLNNAAASILENPAVIGSIELLCLILSIKLFYYGKN